MGSVINFKIVDERVRFDVSLEAADRNSVKLSSRLLTVANQVLKGTP
ncbi:YfiR family protein [Massilia sp. B-10]|nr:YfiR family protein [Massilia sp. B-10]